MNQPDQQGGDGGRDIPAQDTEPTRAGGLGPGRRLRALDELIDGEGDPAVADALRALDRAALASAPLPDPSIIRQSGPFTSIEAYFRSALRQFGELLRLTGLKPRQAVLDYGCGMGRMALPLAAYLDPELGRYCGVDTDARSIEVNRRLLGGRDHLRFEHVDLFNSMYNPDGAPMAQLETLDLGERFDLAFLFSVFTHVLEDDSAPLLRFLARHLEPGATLVSTWFLLNPQSQRGIDEGLAKFRFPFERGGGIRVNHRETPEGAVAYPEDAALARLDACGFAVEQVIPGHWAGTRTSRMGQDVIVARRRGSPSAGSR